MEKYFLGYYDEHPGTGEMELVRGDEVQASSLRAALEEIRNEELFGDIIAGQYIMATRLEDEESLRIDALSFWS